jgi:hypothetical protein
LVDGLLYVGVNLSGISFEKTTGTEIQIASSKPANLKLKQEPQTPALASTIKRHAKKFFHERHSAGFLEDPFTSRELPVYSVLALAPGLPVRPGLVHD